MTRIVCLSDTHSLHEQVNVPEGDMLIHAGDFSNWGTLEDVVQFNAWLGTLKHRFPEGIYVTPGNHDLWVEKNQEEAVRLMTNATLMIQEVTATPSGLTIFASPYQPLFYDWAFQLPRGEALSAKWALIPNGTDIVVTHGPPLGILDTNENDDRFGDADLADAIRRVRPKLHVFGHAHHGHGFVTEHGVQFVNAAICTEDYKPTNAPVVIDLP